MRQPAAILADLDQKIESVSLHICQGSCTDYTQYREKVAERRAMLQMRDYLVLEERPSESTAGSTAGD